MYDYNFISNFMTHTGCWWLLCAAETSSCSWICCNKSCVLTDYVHIIAYYCYNSYDLFQASSNNKVPTSQNRKSVYYGM